MTWQVLILISVVLYSVATLLQRVLLKEEKSDPMTYLVFFQVSTGLMLGVFGLLFKQLSFPDLKPLLPNLFLMMVLNGIGAISQFKALKYVEASRYAVIFSARVFVTILASSFILKEGLSVMQWLGTLLIVAGVTLVNIKSTRLSFSKKEGLALLSAVVFGLSNTNDRFLLKSFKVYPYIFLGYILPAFFVVMLNPYTIRKMKVFLKWQLLKKLLLFSVLFVISGLAFFSALQLVDNSSKVIVINLTPVILTVLLAVVFLKERDNLLEKILGAVLSFIGLLLVS
ncbi:DMT family transporter [Candidatus Microgenomates bacterium]|nr:DMT family transporter [Candidatus Microgenomates bacterium]